MKYVARLFWICLSVLCLVLANCNGDDGPGSPDAQTDASKDSATDATADAAKDAAADGSSTTFNVSSAAAISATKITVTFDAPPDPVEATKLAHYTIASLPLSGVPSLNGNTVTITTAPQSPITYSVAVNGVLRALDNVALTVATANFLGRAPFDVASAASLDSATMTVTFDAIPSTTQATTLANYAVAGLTLSGTPQLSGNIVTIATSAQGAGPYTVIASTITRASDGEPMLTNQAQFGGTPSFNVSSAMATGNTQVQVTFDAAPESTSATTLSNYAIAGLTLSGKVSLKGSTVTFATSSQSPQSYTVVVSNVIRGSDSAALATNQATFQGRTTFNVVSATSLSATSISVTFDAPPDQTAATTLANYTVSGLNLSGTPVLSGNSVTITTDAQTATTYTVVADGIKRASDGEPLTIDSADFQGQ